MNDMNHDFINELSKLALQKYNDILILSPTTYRRIEPYTPYVPPTPLMVWERFYCEWLIKQIERFAQQLHDFADSIGSYCSCDCEY